jgi:hypothetical protein
MNYLPAYQSADISFAGYDYFMMYLDHLCILDIQTITTRFKTRMALHHLGLFCYCDKYCLLCKI